MRNILAAGLLLGAAASAALSDDGNFQWQGKLEPGQLLQIRGVIGSIHAMGTSDANASVTVRKSGKTSDPAEVNIQVAPFEGGVVICAMYPDGNGKPPNVCGTPGHDVYVSANNNDVQVEFTVGVPQGVKLGAYTINGDIEGSGLTADVTAATINGAITVSTTGVLTATTLRGSIKGVMGASTWDGTLLLDAGTGDVSVQIPSDANAMVRASAFRGGVISDFPLTITNSRWGDSTTADGLIGRGGQTLRLSTFSGTITLRQGPPSEQ